MSDFNRRLDEAFGVGGLTTGSIASGPYAMPATPTAPPRTKPATTPSKPLPKPGPFNPPRPKVDPAPKNKIDGVAEMIQGMVTDVIEEAYDDQTHPSTRQFWAGLPQNKQHVFGRHPLFALHGDKLSRGSWAHTFERAQKANTPLGMQQLMQIFMQIMQIERQHSQKLVALAKAITHKIWGIEPESLDAELTNEVDQNQPAKNTGDYSDIVHHVNKRLTINAMTQGSAVHAMLSMHHLVDNEINAIDPRLLQLYTQISTGSHAVYWLLNIPQMLAMLGAHAVGSARVEYDEQGKPIVIAKALCFPVLAQELSKGTAELISHHGLADLDEPTTRRVLDIADDIRHEPYLIQIGPELWRKFLKVRPTDVPLADMVQALNLMDSKELHKLMELVLESPEQARIVLRDLVQKADEPEPQWQDSYGDEGDEGDQSDGPEFDTGSDYEPGDEF